MESHDRTSRKLLIDRLAAPADHAPDRTPHGFSFFQLVRAFEQYLEARTQGPVPGMPDLRNGRLSWLSNTVLVRPSPSLACPAADVLHVERLPPSEPLDRAASAYSADVLPAIDALDERFRLTVSFLGLYGVDSPLPDYYLERIAQYDPYESEIAADGFPETPRRSFLDVFHYRLYALLYGCWKKYRYEVQRRTDGSDVFSRRLFCLLGVPVSPREAVARRRSRPDPPRVSGATDDATGALGTAREVGAKAPSAAASGNLTPSLLALLDPLMRGECPASVIERLLTTALGLPVAIDHYVFRWVRIPAQQQVRLGRRFARMGSSFTLGGRMPSRDTCFAVVVSQASKDDFASLLPGGWRHRRIDELLPRLLRRPLDWTLRVNLHDKARAGTSLGGARRARLGRWAWLGRGSDRGVAVEGGVVC